MSSGATLVTFDFHQMLAGLTGSSAAEWKEVDGPATKCGLDYWYRHTDGREAYINVDQTWLTVSVDGAALFEGDYREAPALRRFVRKEQL